jgi:hypothetical protein
MCDFGFHALLMLGCLHVRTSERRGARERLLRKAGLRYPWRRGRPWRADRSPGLCQWLRVVLEGGRSPDRSSAFLEKPLFLPPQRSKDLSGWTSPSAIVKNPRLWDRALERLEAEEMPPEKAPRHPEKRGQVRFCGGIGKKSVVKEGDGSIFGIWCWVKKRGRAIWLSR